MDGIKNAVVYSLVIDGLYSDHHNFKQLKQSIYTIRQFSNIDIYVYLSSDSFIYDDFFINNNINVIMFNNSFKRWTNRIPESPWNKYLHHRWINIINFFNAYSYDKVLYLDTDTLFYKNPEDLFKKYDKDIFYVKKEFNSSVTQFFINKLGILPGINDGQILLSRSGIDSLKDNFEDIWVDTINTMTDVLYEHLDRYTDHVFFWNVSQYAIFKIILDKVNFEYFNDQDVILGTDYDDVENNDLYIHHYFSGNMSKYYKDCND